MVSSVRWNPIIQDRTQWGRVFWLGPNEFDRYKFSQLNFSDSLLTLVSGVSSITNCINTSDELRTVVSGALSTLLASANRGDTLLPLIDEVSSFVIKILFYDSVSTNDFQEQLLFINSTINTYDDDIRVAINAAIEIFGTMWRLDDLRIAISSEEMVLMSYLDLLDTLLPRFDYINYFENQLAVSDTLLPMFDYSSVFWNILNAADTLSLSLSDVFSAYATLTGDDSILITLGDVQDELRAYLDLNDSSDFIFTDVNTENSVFSLLSDDLAITLGEQMIILSSMLRSDLGYVFFGDEQLAIFSHLNRSDTIQAKLIDNVYKALVKLAVDDQISLIFAENAISYLYLLRPDVIIPDLQDNITSVFVYLSVLDSLIQKLTESISVSAKMSTSDTLSTRFNPEVMSTLGVKVNRNDVLSVLLSDILPQLIVKLSENDDITVSAIDAMLMVYTKLNRSDSSYIKINEQMSLAVRLALMDILNAKIEPESNAITVAVSMGDQLSKTIIENLSLAVEISRNEALSVASDIDQSVDLYTRMLRSDLGFVSLNEMLTLINLVNLSDEFPDIMNELAILKGLIDSQLPIITEHLLEIKRTNSAEVEHLIEVLGRQTAYLDGIVPVDSSYNLPVESLTEFSVTKAFPIENLIGIIYDAPVPIEQNSILDIQSALQVEVLGDYIESLQRGEIEHLLLINSSKLLQIEIGDTTFDFVANNSRVWRLRDQQTLWNLSIPQEYQWKHRITLNQWYHVAQNEGWTLDDAVNRWVLFATQHGWNLE